MVTYVLYNKKAGNGTGLASAEALKQLWSGKTLKYCDVTEISDIKSFLAALDGTDEIVLCGGDGTLNHFVNDIQSTSIENDIYYYPCGSGNDFGHDLGKKKGDAPFKINKYLQNLPTVTVKGRTSRFINGIGYGIDGYCCEEGDRLRETTDKPINYTSIAIKGLLFRYKPTNATVIVDGKEHKFQKVWLAPTMKGRFYGGGMMPTPDQDRLSKDNTVSVMVMCGAGKLKTLSVFPTIFKGEHVKHTKLVSVFKGKSIRVLFDRPVALQIDGETVLNVTEYKVSV